MDALLGEIRLFAGKFAPSGFMLCDGSLVSVSEHDALFSLIGTRYGGDGVTTFAVPDMRGRLPLNKGTGPGLTPRTLGSTGGVETVKLTLAETPSHSHTAFATKGVANSQTPNGGVLATPAGGLKQFGPDKSGSTATPLRTMSPKAIAPAGGSGAAHDNMMPSLAVTYIICARGSYPTPAA